MNETEESFKVVSRNNEAVVYKNKFDNVVTHYKDGSISAPHSVDLETIVKQPEVFIEKGCLEACKLLWDLNISTIESNGHGESSYIVLKGLSEENLQIFKDLKKRDPVHYEIFKEKALTANKGQLNFNVEDFDGEYLSIKFPGRYCIKSKGKISTDLLKDFVLQDIVEGVYTFEEIKAMFYTSKDYEIRPDGKLEIVKHTVQETDESIIEQMTKERKYIYDEKENKFYVSQFYYDKHLKYLESLNTDDGFRC